MDNQHRQQRMYRITPNDDAETAQLKEQRNEALRRRRKARLKEKALAAKKEALRQEIAALEKEVTCGANDE